jgi:hypothetical protein
MDGPVTGHLSAISRSSPACSSVEGAPSNSSVRSYHVDVASFVSLVVLRNSLAWILLCVEEHRRRLERALPFLVAYTFSVMARAGPLRGYEQVVLADAAEITCRRPRPASSASSAVGRRR